MGDDADLVAASDLVVVGTVQSMRVVAENGGIDRIALVDVEQRLKGSAPEAVTLRLPGGELDGRKRAVFGTADVKSGEHVLLFLRERPDGTYSTTQMAVGKYRLVGSGPSALAVRDLQGAAVLGRRQGRVLRRVSQEVRHFPAFEESLRAGGADEEQTASQLLSLTQSFRGAFQMLGDTPSRWYEPDEGRALVFMLEPEGAAATGLDVDWALSQALSGWSRIECGGLDLRSNHEGVRASFRACDGRSQILLNDPLDEMDPPVRCGGVLATGGFCAVTGDRVLNGVTYDRITEGDVIIADGFESCEFWNDIDLSELLAHELGHTIGLGHSSENRDEPDPVLRDALMYFRAHFDGRGVAIMEDDRNAICTVYPKPQLPDSDGDGVFDPSDDCPDVADPAQTDRDGDGIGDACDPLTIERAQVNYREGTGRLESRLKLAGTLRPERPFDHDREIFELEIRAGSVLAHTVQIAPGAWNLTSRGGVLRALIRSERGIETIVLYRQPDGSYKFRVRGRGISMLGPRDAGLVLAVSMGDYTAGCSLPLHPLALGRLAYPASCDVR